MFVGYFSLAESFPFIASFLFVAYFWAGLDAVRAMFGALKMMMAAHTGKMSDLSLSSVSGDNTRRGHVIRQS